GVRQRAVSVAANNDHVAQSRGRCTVRAAALLLRLPGDDQVADLIVGPLGNDLLLHQLVLGAVGAALDDLVGVSVADSGQGFELGFRGGVYIQQVAGLGGGRRSGRL